MLACAVAFIVATSARPGWVDQPPRSNRGEVATAFIAVGTSRAPQTSEEQAGEWAAFVDALGHVAELMAPSNVEPAELEIGIAARVTASKGTHDASAENRSSHWKWRTARLRFNGFHLAAHNRTDEVREGRKTTRDEKRSSELRTGEVTTDWLLDTLRTEGLEITRTWRDPADRTIYLEVRYEKGNPAAKREAKPPVITNAVAKVSGTTAVVTATIEPADAFAPIVFWRARGDYRWQGEALRKEEQWTARFELAEAVDYVPDSIEYFVEAWDPSVGAVGRSGSAAKPLTLEIRSGPKRADLKPLWLVMSGPCGTAIGGAPALFGVGSYSHAALQRPGLTDDSPPGEWTALMRALDQLGRCERRVRTDRLPDETTTTTDEKTGRVTQRSTSDLEGSLGHLKVKSDSASSVISLQDEVVERRLSAHRRIAYGDLLATDSEESDEVGDHSEDAQRSALSFDKTDTAVLLLGLKDEGIEIADKFTASDGTVSVLAIRDGSHYDSDAFERARGVYPALPVRPSSAAPSISLAGLSIEHGFALVNAAIAPADAFAPTVFWRSNAKDTWHAEAIRKQADSFRARIPARSEFYAEVWNRTAQRYARIAAPDAPLKAELPKKMIAILEFTSALAEDQKRDLDRTYFSDRVRGRALRAFPDARILTRENMQTLAKARGVDLEKCDSLCEVEIGQRLDADLVVSGELRRIGGLYRLTLKLYEVQTARLLDSEEAAAKDPAGLIKKTDEATDALFGAAK